MSSIGAASRAAVPISNARAEASRKNGAKSRGPRTAEGKARSSRNTLKQGLRAQKYKAPGRPPRTWIPTVPWTTRPKGYRSRLTGR